MSALDYEHLGRVAAELPRPLFEAMAQGFGRETVNFLFRMNLGLDRRDLNLVARAAHDLRGYAGNFGATTVSQTTERIEAACQAADLRAASDLVRQARHDCAIAWTKIVEALEAPRHT